MADAEEIKLAVPRDQLDAIRSAVADGEYGSTADVVIEALKEWQRQRGDKQEDVERLRRLWQDGLASGPSSSLDMADVKVRGRDLLLRRSAGLSD